MTTRLLLLLITTALLIAVAGAALTHWQPANPLGYSLSQWGLNAGQLGGLVLLLQTGSILGTRYFTIVAVCVALALLGAVFTIMHWVGGREILLAGLLGIMLTYTIRFFRKSFKARLDWLKWLWVLATTISAAGILQHWLPREAAYVAQTLFWLAVLDVAVGYGQRVSAER